MSPLPVRSLVAASGGALSLVGSFLPWMRTGERSRSSYELADVARRLNILSGSFERGIVRVWPFVPMVTVLAVAALVLWFGFLSRAVAVVVALFVLGVALLVTNAPVDSLGGTQVTAVGAVLVIMAASWRSKVAA